MNMFKKKPVEETVSKTRRAKCESGVCALPKVGEVVPKIGEVVPAVGEVILPADYISTSKIPDYAETVRTITDQLNQIIQYADNLRQENDRLARQLARVREAVE